MTAPCDKRRLCVVVVREIVLRHGDGQTERLVPFIFALECVGVGFICGFVGAGGGIMMLLVLTSVLGYELKTAVGTSVFIMAFTALTGSISHFAIGGMPDLPALVLCVVFTLIWARIGARFANKAPAKVLNRATGIILVILGAVVLSVKLFA